MAQGLDLQRREPGNSKSWAVARMVEKANVVLWFNNDLLMDRLCGELFAFRTTKLIITRRPGIERIKT